MRAKRSGLVLNRGFPLARHLWGCWMMDGRDDRLGARLRDLSGRENHGTWDGASGAADYVDGPLGRELQFDNGTTEQILLDKRGDQGGLMVGENECCVEAWIRFGGPTSATEFNWFGSWTAPHAISCAYDSTNNRIEFFIGTSTGLNGWGSTTDIDDGLYHHVVCQYSAITARMEIWLDGAFQEFKAHTGTLFPGANDPIYIGAQANNSDNFDGRISFIRFYNRSLGHNWISRLYAYPMEMFNPVRHVPAKPPSNPCLLITTADAVGPTAPLQADRWDGRPPEGV